MVVRGLSIAVAVLMLAGCGASEADKPAKVQVPAVAQVMASQWDVLVLEPKAVSDLTDRLIEHGFPSYVAVLDGKERVLLGPFNSKAEADAKRVELVVKMNYAASVIDHKQ